MIGKIIKKHGWMVVILLALLFVKFYFFQYNYDRYHVLVSLSTFLLYFILLFVLIRFFIRRKYTIATNLTVFVALLLLIEFSSYMLLGFPKKEWKGYPVPDLPKDHKGYYLGNVPWADSVIHDVQKFEGEVFADVSYSIDSLNRRSVPERDNNKSKYAIFFGCSVCFGFGLEDNQTIPFLFQEKTNTYNAYNYAYNGWGPHHMLSLFEHENIAAEIEEEEGMAVYIFLWSHIRRAIGDFQVYTGWGHGMPYYTMENGELKNKGNFVQGRGFISRIYEKLYKSYTIKFFELNFPLNTNESHYKLVVEIINRSKELYKDQFGNDDFIVLIYPDIWDELDDERMKVFLNLLDEDKIKYVNYSDKSYLIKGSYILMDGHPNVKSNTEISEMLVKDLDLK